MNIPLLAAKELVKCFPLRKEHGFGRQAELRAVDGVSLALYDGETVGIAGESGCGKSTMARMLCGLLPPDSGTVQFRGTGLTMLDREQRLTYRRAVQMIFQDPFSSLNPRLRIGDAIAEPLALHTALPAEVRRAQTAELMTRVGLSADLYDRFPHEFSGGQRQRIGIARALAASPQILIADEPVSSLDISIQAQIINLLLELKASRNLTMLIISHDLNVLRHLCDRIAVMYLGTLVELAPARSLMSDCRHPYTAMLLEAIPRLHAATPSFLPCTESSISTETTDHRQGCRFHPRCPHARELCRNNRPVLHETAPGHWTACHRSTELFRD